MCVEINATGSFSAGFCAAQGTSCLHVVALPVAKSCAGGDEAGKLPAAFTITKLSARANCGSAGTLYSPEPTTTQSNNSIHSLFSLNQEGFFLG